ncbi:MarC family protein [Bdellovibrio bacteriovorus]|uniref:MarC family protein n=1 Tax=Bdellovibrio bacteriovorus TaxID=959 RepID=UPI0035A73A64
MEFRYVAGPSELFTIFFIMVGPLGHLGQFAKVTRNMAQDQINTLAFKSLIIIMPVIVVLGLLGKQLMIKWHIPAPVLELTAGIIFALVAFKILLASDVEAETAGTPQTEISPLTVALKMLINPHSVGTLIVLLALSHHWDRTVLVLGLFVANLILDALALKYIRILMGKVGRVIMQILGSVLGVLQAALALTIIHASLMMLAQRG